MLVVVTLLALLQAFFINQLVFWVAWPLSWIIFSIVFVKQLKWHELLRWAAVYGLIYGTFIAPSQQLRMWVGLLLGTCGFILVRRVLLRYRFLRSKHLVMTTASTTVFCALYFAVQMIGYGVAIAWSAAGIWLAGTIALNSLVGWSALRFTHAKKEA